MNAITEQNKILQTRLDQQQSVVEEMKARRSRSQRSPRGSGLRFTKNQSVLRTSSLHATEWIRHLVTVPLLCQYVARRTRGLRPGGRVACRPRAPRPGRTPGRSRSPHGRSSTPPQAPQPTLFGRYGLRTMEIEGGRRRVSYTFSNYAQKNGSCI